MNLRKSNYELLRIISMILILMSHSDDIFGLADLYSKTLGLNKIITDWLHIGGQIGVGCFILITGYFMVEKNITTKKILRVTGEVWFYSITLWGIWILAKLYTGEFELTKSLEEAKYAFFPISFSHYWFATAYVILMIFSPFLNKLIIALNHQEYRRLLTALIVIYVIIMGGIPNAFFGISGGRLMPMVVLYFIAGYIKRFRTEKKHNAGRHLIVAFVVYLLLFATFYLITYAGIKKNDELLLDQRYFYRVLNSPFVVAICVELFLGFTEMEIKYNPIINGIAGCTFGVYLIHQHRRINSILGHVFPIYKETRSGYIFIYSVGAVILMYLVCTLIDYVRRITVEKVWISFLDKHLKN